MPLQELSTIQKRGLVNGISSIIICFGQLKKSNFLTSEISDFTLCISLAFLSSLFIVGYAHAHKLLEGNDNTLFESWRKG
jgi:hypothetical protein